MNVIKWRHTRPNITLNEIGEAVCEVFNISEQELRNYRSPRLIAKSMCIYLAKMKTKTRLSWYYEYFDGLRAGELLNMHSMMSRMVRKDSDLFDKMELIIGKIG